MSWLGLAGSLLGGLINSNSQSNTNSANVKAQKMANQTNVSLARMNNRVNHMMVKQTNAANAASIDRTNLNNKRMSDNANAANMRIAADTNAANERLARNSVRYRVEDARAAGINPLAALGAPSMGGIATGAMIQPSQDIAHQAQAPQSQAAVVQATQRQANFAVGDAVAAGLAMMPSRAQVRREALENDLLRSQIRQTDASSAAIVAEARSRSMISSARAASIGGAAPTSLQSGLGRLVDGSQVRPRAREDAFYRTPLGYVPRPETMGYDPVGDLTDAYGEGADLVFGGPMIAEGLASTPSARLRANAARAAEEQRAAIAAAQAVARSFPSSFLVQRNINRGR